jgi:hypothetical protein
MSSLKLVQAEVNRFLQSANPEILCVSGEWGVGKTYTWQILLDDAIAKRKIALNQYAYVSLFGLNSLESLKLAIFENSEFLLEPEEGVTAAAKELGNKVMGRWPRRAGHSCPPYPSLERP